MPPKPLKGPPSRGPNVPKNWPQNVTYTSAPSYSPKLPPAALTSLLTRPRDAQEIPVKTQISPCPHVNVKPILTPTHPAYGQYGLFATKSLKPGDFIIQYIGIYHCSSSSTSEPDPHADSNYDLSLDREHSIGIDADKMGNEARFINDYRGVAERPNSEFREIWDPKRKERGMGVWVLGAGKWGNNGFRGVKKGDEILVSYGKGFWGARKEEGGGEEVKGS